MTASWLHWDCASQAAANPSVVHDLKPVHKLGCLLLLLARVASDKNEEITLSTL